MQVANARYRLRLQQPQQLPHIFICLEGELIPWRPVLSLGFFLQLLEINQQRLVAGKLESCVPSLRQVHSRESIPHAAAPLAQEAFLPVSAKLRTLGRGREGVRVRVRCAQATRRARTPRALRRSGLA